MKNLKRIWNTSFECTVPQAVVTPWKGTPQSQLCHYHLYPQIQVRLVLPRLSDPYPKNINVNLEILWNPNYFISYSAWNPILNIWSVFTFMIVTFVFVQNRVSTCFFMISLSSGAVMMPLPSDKEIDILAGIRIVTKTD